MGNELVRAGRSVLAKTDDQTFSRAAGGALVKTGLGATGLWMLAGMLPFITFPMLLVAAVAGGIFLYAKD
jgi:hypothetical protein